jgi:hypothetical protein
MQGSSPAEVISIPDAMTLCCTRQAVISLTPATELIEQFDANVTEAEETKSPCAHKSLEDLKNDFIASEPSLQQNTTLLEEFEATVYTYVRCTLAWGFSLRNACHDPIC